MFFTLFCERIFLGRNKVINPSVNASISKKPKHFYYVQCPKEIENCPKFLKYKLGNGFHDNTFVLRNDLYAAYLSADEANSLLKSGILLQKLPKNHKIDKREILNTTNQYIALVAAKCQVPYRYTVVSKQTIIFESDEPVETVLNTTKRIPCIRKVEQLPPVHLNTRFSRNIAQKKKVDWQNETLWRYSSRNTYAEHGLGGHGQIASIADTGLDPDLCWFKDPDQDLAFEINDAMDHRKVLTYFRYADNKDDVHGHGTFVAGIIAGNAICPNEDDDEKCPGTLYDGVAPNTRLIICDIFRENSKLIQWPGNGSELFFFPRYLSAALQLHAFDFNMKSLFTFSIDQLQFYLPQMLFIFAAGDTGPGNNRVPSPGEAKNVLTVGAVYPPEISLNEIDDATPIIVVKDGKEFIGYCDPFHGKTLIDLISRSEYLGEPIKFPIGDIQKEVMIITDGIDITGKEECAAFIVFGDKEIKGKVSRPVIRLPETTEAVFGTTGEVEFKIFEDLSGRHIAMGINTSNPMTKYGPVNIARIKPEIVMPGGPVLAPDAYAREGELCGPDGLRKGEGTSVAAAFASGDIMLIRQYFKHGFYPSGEKERENIIKSSNHMLRAILANIAEPVEGTFNQTGFGRPQIDKVLIFKDEYKRTPNLYGYRLHKGTGFSKTSQEFTFKAEADGLMKVTMAWNDPPHDPDAPSDVLFRLDLRVEDSHGSPPRVGNRKADEFPAYDAHNTVKQISVDVRKDEEYHIYVIIQDLLDYENVSFTLFMSGPFDHFGNGGLVALDKVQIEPRCPNSCEGGGVCENGFCACPEGRFGDMCQTEIRQANNGETIEEDPFQSYEVGVYEYTIDKWNADTKLEIDFKTTKDQKLFWMFSIDEPPTWHRALQSLKSHDFCIIQDSKIILDFENYDFLHEGDKIIFAVYSVDQHDCTFQLTFNLREIEHADQE